MPAGMAKRLMRLEGKVTKILAGAEIAVGLTGSTSLTTRLPSLASPAWAADFDFAKSLQGLTQQDPAFKKLVKIGVAQYFRSHTFTAKLVAKRPAPGPSSGNGEKENSVELAPLRNKQWSSAPFFTMGGLRTSFSGQFSRSRRAYFALLAEGAASPAFISLDDLLDGDAGILVNKMEYRLTLKPNFFDPPGSKLLIRQSGASEGQGVSMRKILDKVYRNGMALEHQGKKFRLFFGQDVDDSGQTPCAGSEESLALLLPEGDGYVTFLIHLEEVPADSIGVFELRDGLKLPLRLAKGSLEAY
jgi:hypothetical protein